MKKKIVKILFVVFVFFVSMSLLHAAAPAAPVLDIGGTATDCYSILGKNLTKVVHAFITVVQIVAAIIAIVQGMMILIPPIVAKDADALKKATKKLVDLVIILIIILLFRPLIRLMGNILELDISCIF